MNLIRIVDFLAALFGLILLSPFILIIALILFIEHRKPFFIQERVGKDQKLFTLMKFRSMSPKAANLPTHEISADLITKTGKFIRVTKLDELPQLWNVLKGEMSLVGPRPLPIHYLERYTPRQNQRHNIRPGITGWAQVNGRNGLSWERQFELDLWYVEHHSLWLDLKILARTVITVFQRKNISEDGHATRSEFFGSKIR